MAAVCASTMLVQVDAVTEVWWSGEVAPAMSLICAAGVAGWLARMWVSVEVTLGRREECSVWPFNACCAAALNPSCLKGHFHRGTHAGACSQGRYMQQHPSSA